MSSRGPALVALVIILGLTGLAYAFGVSGPFVFDDFPNIVRNPYLTPAELNARTLTDAAVSGGATLLGRPLAMVSFAFNGHFWGMTPTSFKVTNIVIHLVNGLLVYALAYQLFSRWFVVNRSVPPAPLGPVALTPTPDSRWLAVIVMAIWLLHPIQLTAVLYVVQRMVSLSAIWVFVGLLGFIWARDIYQSHPVRGMVCMLVGTGAAVVLGIAAKENALLLVPLLVVIEWTVLRRDELSPRSRQALYLFYLFLIGLPLLGIVGLVWFEPSKSILDYGHRDFGPFERLLTEARVLFGYLKLVLYPDLSAFGLFHDTIPLSRGWLSPPATLFAVLAWVGAAGFALFCWRRYAIAAFGVGWFLVAHSLESSIIPLEIAFEHRNYVPLFGVAVLLVGLGAYGVARLGPSAIPRIAVVALVIALTGLTAMRADNWSSATKLATFLAAHHPTSARSLELVAVLSKHHGQPHERIFANYRAVAAVSEHGISPLVEMRKLLAVTQWEALRTRPANAESQSEGARVTDAPPRSGTGARNKFASRLAYPTNAESHTHAVSAIENEISWRLRYNPVGVDAAKTLVSLQQCMRTRQAPCMRLRDQMRAWHEVALRSPRLVAALRARIEISLAHMLADDGEPAQALRAADRAIALRTGDFGIALQYIQLCAELEAWTAGEAMLGQLARQLGRWANRDAFEFTKAQFEAARARAKKEGSTS